MTGANKIRGAFAPLLSFSQLPYYFFSFPKAAAIALLIGGADLLSS